jgi:hypothetical protein
MQQQPLVSYQTDHWQSSAALQQQALSDSVTESATKAPQCRTEFGYEFNAQGTRENLLCGTITASAS